MRVKHDTRAKADPLAVTMAVRRELNKLYDEPTVFVASGNITAEMFSVVLDAASAVVDATLPDPDEYRGMLVIVKCSDDTAGATIIGTIDNAADLAMATGDSVMLKAGNGTWWAY